ncbi:MAG TPA: cytochrome P450 [Pseudomonadota bacterium]|nr:cytochrome P450 [Pseudomonadota bacterium]
MNAIAAAETKQVPGPSVLSTPICLSAFRRDPLGFLSDMHRRYGDTVRLPLGLSLISVSHPSAIRHVLQENHRSYDKGLDYARLEVAVGKGLLTSNGALWKRHRRLTQPAFHKQRLAGFAQTIISRTEQRLAQWRKQGRELQVDLHAELMALTLEIVGECLFSADLSSQTEEFGLSVGEVLRLTNDYLNQLMPLPLWLPTPFALRFRRELAVLDRAVKSVIEARYNSDEELGQDLLGMLLSAHQQTEGAEAEQPLSVQEIRDEVMTLILAGHETTANALSFALLLLSQNQHVADTLKEQTRQALGTRAPTFADLSQLRYAKQVAEESLRLYPPAWAFGRRATAPDVIDGYEIPVGTHILLSPFLTQRDARFFPQPLRFDPTRFAPEQTAQRPHGYYFPFAAGPRQCIGMGFAMMELQLILSTLVQQVEITVLSPNSVELEPQITLRPRGGLRATIRFRTAAQEGAS